MTPSASPAPRKRQGKHEPTFAGTHADDWKESMVLQAIQLAQ